MPMCFDLWPVDTLFVFIWVIMVVLDPNIVRFGHLCGLYGGFKHGVMTQRLTSAGAAMVALFI